MPTIRTISIPTQWPRGNPPRVLRYERNGIGPSGVAIHQLADRVNSLVGQRKRAVFVHASPFGLHADFDNTATGDTTVFRALIHCDATLGWAGAFLPYRGSPTTSVIKAQLKLTTGATGAGSTTTTDLFMPASAATADLTMDDVIWGAMPVTATAGYNRLELHLFNKARIVSTTVWEIIDAQLDSTVVAAAVDDSNMYRGADIDQATLADVDTGAAGVYEKKRPLFAWTTDYPGDEKTRTSATAANLIDQTVTTATATTQGWPINIGYSGKHGSPDVAALAWCYAEMAGGGNGTVEFRDQANSVLNSITITGAATWYTTTLTLADATGGTPTTKIDVFIGGDGANAVTVYAAGVIMAPAV